MKKIYSGFGYDFYIGLDSGIPFYNIVPSGSPKPNAGYYNSEWLCDIKKVRNIFLEY